MWVIICNRSLIEHRDHLISNLLDDPKPNNYLSKRSATRYSSTSSLLFASIYKTESGAIRLINEFNTSSKHQSSSKFYWVNDYHLMIHKLTKDEYNSIIDYQIQMLDRRYNKQRTKLVSKKL